MHIGHHPMKVDEAKKGSITQQGSAEPAPAASAPNARVTRPVSACPASGSSRTTLNGGPGPETAPSGGGSVKLESGALDLNSMLLRIQEVEANGDADSGSDSCPSADGMSEPDFELPVPVEAVKVKKKVVKKRPASARPAGGKQKPSKGDVVVRRSKKAVSRAEDHPSLQSEAHNTNPRLINYRQSLSMLESGPPPTAGAVKRGL